jgi:hypothetical protein
MKIMFMALVLWAGAVVTAKPPVKWKTPDSFNKKKMDLGLSKQSGVKHYLLYDPNPNDDKEGMVNHHPDLLIYKNNVIVTWTRHQKDENGPGQHVAAALIPFDAETGKPLIKNKKVKTYTLLPAPLDIRRRSTDAKDDVIDEAYGKGYLCTINGRLYFHGFIAARHGWSNQSRYSGISKAPVPVKNWSNSKSKKFRFDVGWDLGLIYFQEYKVKDSAIVPAGKPYLLSKMLDRIEVATGKVKTVKALKGNWANFSMLDKAPEQFQNDVRKGRRHRLRPSRPKYKKGTSHLAKDGINFLAHYSQFKRKDGGYTVIRDNLRNPGYYYASSKPDDKSFYPPGERTNLYGHAMPAAGNLPDGRAFIIANTVDRKHMWIYLSDDGITFNEARHLLYINRKVEPGIGKPKEGGPQYFRVHIIGDYMWIVYSIAKEQIGLTLIDINQL